MFRTAHRYTTRAAIDRVAALVGVSESGQDWDIENADATRVEVFCDAYERLDLNRAERFALMKLIIASYDDVISTGASDSVFERIRAALTTDFAIHFHTVRYWSCLGEPVDNAFDVAPPMREIYEANTPALVRAVLDGNENDFEHAFAAKLSQEILSDALLGAAPTATLATVTRLLDAGASVDSREQGGDTALICAAAAGRPDVTALFLERGADVNATSPHWTAAVVATMNGHLETLRVLLAAGADPQFRDDNGYDALMFAAEHGHAHLIETLLAAGAVLGKPNKNGEDALAIAQRHVGYGASVEQWRAIVGRLSQVAGLNKP